MLRLIVITVAAVLLAACTTGETEAYPRLGDAPAPPETTLSPERSAQITRELEQARDEAIDFAAQGRRSGTGPAVPVSDPEPEPEIESDDALEAEIITEPVTE